MNLKNSGFNVSDERAKNSTGSNPLQYAELIITDSSTLRCNALDGIVDKAKGTLQFSSASHVIDIWGWGGLKHICFSGGEPTKHYLLPSFVDLAKSWRMERISVSTDGQASIDLYKSLIKRGVTDFNFNAFFNSNSIINGNSLWSTAVKNIKELAKLSHTTLEIVLTEENAPEIGNLIEFVHILGVSDIKISPRINFYAFESIPSKLFDGRLMLKYRVNSLKNGNAFGLRETDTNKCPLVMDEMTVAGNCHFPCGIYLRNGGNPIGQVKPHMRKDRIAWAISHNTHEDPICKNYCPDIYREFNNKWVKYSSDKVKLPKFTTLDFHLAVLNENESDLFALDNAIGFGRIEIDTENSVAVMFNSRNNEKQWKMIKNEPFFDYFLAKNSKT